MINVEIVRDEFGYFIFRQTLGRYPNNYCCDRTLSPSVASAKNILIRSIRDIAYYDLPKYRREELVNSISEDMPIPKPKQIQTYQVIKSTMLPGSPNYAPISSSLK